MLDGPRSNNSGDGQVGVVGVGSCVAASGSVDGMPASSVTGAFFSVESGDEAKGSAIVSSGGGADDLEVSTAASLGDEATVGPGAAGTGAAASMGRQDSFFGTPFLYFWSLLFCV